MKTKTKTTILNISKYLYYANLKEKNALKNSKFAELLYRAS